MAEGFDNDIAELLRYGTEARAEVQSIVDETAAPVDPAALAASPAMKAAFGQASGAQVDAFGADPTGQVDATAAFSAALASLPTTVVNNGTASVTYHVGSLILGRGVYRLGASADLGNVGPFVSVIGPGKAACRLDYRGGGDCLRAWNEIDPRMTSNTFDVMFDQAKPYGLSGRFDGFTIDGTNAIAGAIGLHVGDCEGMVFGPDLFIQHFNKPASIGLWVENKVSWFENARATKLNLYDCTTHVRMTGSSLSYNDLEFKIWAMPNQDGVVIDGGGAYFHGSLRVRANFGMSATTNTAAALRITGSGSGSYSRLQACTVSIQAECNNLEGASGAAAAPQTVVFGDPTKHKIDGCLGILDFSGNKPWVVSNWAPSIDNHFSFDGYISGDTALSPAYPQTVYPVIAPHMATSTLPRSIPQGQVYAGKLDLQSGDFFDLGQLAADTAVTFGNPVFKSPRRLFVRVQQGSTIRALTWPSNTGTPSVTNPTVLWEGAVPPLMTRRAFAFDFYELWTLDGATWYGRQRAGVAAAPALPMGAYRNRVQATAVTSQTISPNATIPAGATAFLFVANTTAGSTATPTITDSAGNAWVVDRTVGSTGAVLWLARTTVAADMTTAGVITVAWSASTSATLTLLQVTGLGSAPKLDRFNRVDLGTTPAANVTIDPGALTQRPAEISLAFVAAPTGNVSNPTWTVAGTGPDPVGSFTQSNSGAAIPTQVAWLSLPASKDQTSVTFTPSTAQPMTVLMATYSA